MAAGRGVDEEKHKAVLLVKTALVLLVKPV